MKKQPVQQPQQTSPFHANASVPGFANNNAFAQNATYKNPGGMAQNLNSNRGSPMTHNQPLLSRDPLPPHSQSPHPAPQQTPQASVTPQHQVPHPSHQFNMHLPQGRFNPGMQGQPGQPMPQHPIPQAHHPQQTAARTAQGPHDPSQAMMHPQMQYGPMAQYPYQHMHMQTMMNGVRMPNMQGTPVAGAQFIPGQWRIPAGRGAGPMTTMPMHNQQFQQQQQQMLAAMSRAQAAQQTQPQGQGR
ncbi:hypothetical protein K439DRAFT_343134 [Ramaria rubella]|nr:hypothetical protein K439DRAFT_343134 [Ramaria rubella]